MLMGVEMAAMMMMMITMVTFNCPTWQQRMTLKEEDMLMWVGMGLFLEEIQTPLVCEQLC